MIEKIFAKLVWCLTHSYARTMFLLYVVVKGLLPGTQEAKTASTAGA